MSIIVEGVDGSGKTTLIQKLQYDFPQLSIHPRFCTSKGGPIDNLASLVWDDRQELISRRDLVYDRHPLISEYIYGHDVGRGVNPDFFTQAAINLRARMISDDVLVIFCRPPLEVLKLNLDPDHEMPGVYENIDKLYESYRIAEVMWRCIANLTSCALYDFTDQQSYWYVRALVARHLERTS